MPGTLIRERTARIARTLPTDTGVFFMSGMSDKGAVTDAVNVVQSTAEWETKFGHRNTDSISWDCVDAFFSEGGSKLYFSRVFGPNPVTAFVNLNDGSAVAALKVSAASPGAWGNTLNVQVTAGDAGGEFKLVLTDDVDTTINETSPSFVDQAAAIAYYANHQYIRLSTLTSALDPAVVAAQSLATGTDDRANATDATWLSALSLFAKELGPGQVAYAGRTTITAQGQLADHAKTNNRVALLDPADQTVTATAKTAFLAAASAVRALTNGKYAAMFAPWVNLPALAAGGTTRAVPASCVVAGIIARNDGRGMSPNDPAAGISGLLQYDETIRVSGFTTQDLTDLNEGSVNMIISKAGDLRVYGFRTTTSKTTNPLWWQLANLRLYMAIAAKADNILERFVFRKIDGRRKVFGELDGVLSGMLSPYWEDGSLYGVNPGDAFYVDTGPQVNTPTTINNGEIHAALELTMSPMGETVILDIVRRAVTA